MSETDLCSVWGRAWAESMPDGIVAEKVDGGMVDAGCLPDERVLRMVEDDLVDEDDLDEELREELSLSAEDSSTEDDEVQETEA